MDFDVLVGRMDDTLTATFRKIDKPSGQVIQLVIHPRDGSGDVSVDCIVESPAIQEDYMPGSAQGSAMLWLFVPASAGVDDLRSDTATYNGVDYDVVQSDDDRCGGVHIRLRKRSFPWNQ